MADPTTVAAAVTAAPYVLPWWIVWVQTGATSLGVLAVAVFGAFIARKQVSIASAQAEIALRQSRIAIAKLNLDLYDRRFKIFQAAQTYFQEVLSGEALTATLRFNIATAEATFLFEKEVEDYLKELRQRGTKLHAKRRQLRAMDESRDDDPRRHALIDESSDLEQQFGMEYPQLIAAFKPYLKLGNI